jgi:hypothetical protein
VPDPIGRFAGGQELAILLNSAGGFRKASVQVHNLQFGGLLYETAETPRLKEPAPEPGAGGVPGHSGAAADAETADYALVAFQWADANLLRLNSLCNDAIAEGLMTMLIPARDLPHPHSWPEVCRELARNGFAEALVQADGIGVAIPE